MHLVLLCPCLLDCRVTYDRGQPAEFNVRAVPVRPGQCRVFAKFIPRVDPTKKTPLIFKLMRHIPHWAFTGTMLLDQDTVVMAKQQAIMQQEGLTPDDFAQFARADQGIIASHRWFKLAKYEEMWAERLPAGAAAQQLAAQQGQPPTEKLLDIYNRHTKHCKECQQVSVVGCCRKCSGISSSSHQNRSSYQLVLLSRACYIRKQP